MNVGLNKSNGSGELNGIILLIRIIENNKAYVYFMSGWVK